ncbi:MAG: hypothetical protein ACRDN6_13780 [Gaiellaceae bacterium]
MATVQAAAESEEARLISWRQEELERAGYTKRAALLLALEKAIDLHLAVDLLRSGCPPKTALRILL